MPKLVKTLALAPVVVAAAGFLFLLTAMRTKTPWMLRSVGQVNKRCWNRAALRTAGSPGAAVAVVHHVGRVSGRAYATPVSVQAVDDGFVIALPYGMHSDWLSNLLAAGGGVIRHDGSEHVVTEPRVLPITEFLAAFPVSDQRGFRVFNITDCVHLRRTTAEDVTPAQETTSA
jgi:deazaflavin-dependent oxidoreductase (nitroreductase family)